MSSVTTMHAKLGQAMGSGPRAPQETEIPNAVPNRRSLPVQIDMIEVEDRLRSVDQAAVEHIAESMEQRGQIYPIQIRTIEPGRFRLVTGAHRIAGALRLGWTHIEAFLVDDLEEEEFRLLEIDENLCRAELSPVDKAHFFATRKDIYQRLHPETKHGAHLKWPQWPHGENSALPSGDRAPSFVEDTAASTPWSPRTVRRYTRIGERLDPQLREALSGTPVGRRLNDLERIADMDANKQQDLLQRLQDAERPPVSLSALTTDPYRPSSRPDPFERLQTLWNRTPQTHQRRFFAWVQEQMGGEL
ncbi:MAG: hypothetical protein F4Y03_07785 [Alphaproteobacteria bacterium]|nr:hypothetical protein [Alphaproteobacteria bacterium]